MAIAIVMGGLVFLLLLFWAVQIIRPSPWERKRRHRQRAGRSAGRQDLPSESVARFHRKRR